jgi:hypothetical protein
VLLYFFLGENMTYSKRVLNSREYRFTTAQWFSKPEAIRARFRRMMEAGYCFYVIVP